MNEEQQQQPQSNDEGVYPILIIPGFMSSGLEIIESKHYAEWVTKRVWINVASIGFGIFRGKNAIEDQQQQQGDNENIDDEAYQQEQRCKSTWLQHMSLSDDMVHERNGIMVRPISGLTGVDYLTPGALMEHVSYVFGPVIQALNKAGWTSESSPSDPAIYKLHAAPYDWRIPPKELEKRDSYFTNTMTLIENIYKGNNNTPVILLCHSMGCKTGHYLLNFIHDHPKGGKEWIDTYIHAYMPVGAPHLGAPKTFRGLIDGDKMGLDAFLTEEEGLIMGRSLGSVPWLIPHTLPSHLPSSYLFIRKEGMIQMTIPSPIDCTALKKEYDKIQQPYPKLRLVIKLGSNVITTKFVEPMAHHMPHKLLYEYKGTFIFPTTTSDSIPSTQEDGMIYISLQEPGIKKSTKHNDKEQGATSCIMNIICCPIKYILCLPCYLPYCLVKKTVIMTHDVALAGADLAAKTMGAGTAIAQCGSFPVTEAFQKSKNDEVQITRLLHIVTDNEERASHNKQQPAISISVHMKWIPFRHPSKVEETKIKSKESPMAIKSSTSANNQSNISIYHHKKNDVSYEEVNGCELIMKEGMYRTLDVIKEYYENDPIGPRTRSSTDAPPISRVIAIFGINRSTEIGSVYRRKAFLYEGNINHNHEHHQQHQRPITTKLQKFFELDSSARLRSSSSFVTLKNGVLYENGTGSADDNTNKSGDGTVPYWSMEQCRTWHNDTSCQVKVIEIPNAEHRDILADERFHTILIENATKNNK